MTPEPGTGHPDVEALDGYAGGDTTDRDVVAHVAGCPACGAVVEGLIRVRVDLARLRPVPMPDDVAARIRAALRAEPPPVPAGGAGGAGGAAAGRALRARRVPGLPRRPAAAKLAAAAAAGVTALAVGVGILTSSGGTAGRTAAPAPSGPGAPGPEARGGGGPAGPVRPDGAGVSSTPPAATLPATVVAASDTPVTPATLAQRARDLVAGRTSVLGTLWNGTYSPSGRFFGRADTSGSPAGEPGREAPVDPGLQLCYLTLAGRSGGLVLGVDRVRFGGSPAVTVVVSLPADPRHLRVLVVDPACTAASAAGSIRYQTVVPR